MNFTPRSVALPVATLGPDANTSCSGGQYTNTHKSMQEKHFGLRVGVGVANSLVAQVTLYELIQQEPRQPLLIMPNYSTMIQEVASDVPQSHAVQLIK
jgi:hypothetical protein